MSDILYKKSNLKRLQELSKLVPKTFQAFNQFNQSALSEGVLSKKLKELIAVAVAHVTGCPYCIEAHVGNAKKLDVSKEEISEAILVATALKAGSSIAHGVNALNAFDNIEDDELYKNSFRERFKEFADLSPEPFRAFVEFDTAAMKSGLLSSKEKELIAVAVTHVTDCPYCIEAHIGKAKKLGATLEEVAESIFVATALKAGSAYTHSVNALNAYDR
ncbi:carboxymuconolactone decarboxylase family protein [Oceanobacillus neutriphilus]|uniref:Carboxymuconolactone decarboxylase-like domain-containing protein n=1 Tax=Oceanobacillus neutriphilus TaxID=531815 RepID=A0ABQ2P1C3_9BACI|nr:carboxymuconolactone decarboxylase family protein [Oceanobacillus neutriphilus]GGP15829.1 hypothetical protein GCM10011346_45330 [Oceanobacillus neutriphilus]